MASGTLPGPSLPTRSRGGWSKSFIASPVSGDRLPSWMARAAGSTCGSHPVTFAWARRPATGLSVLALPPKGQRWPAGEAREQGCGQAG